MLHQLPATDAAGQTLSAAAANALDATSHYLANVLPAVTGPCFLTGQIGNIAFSTGLSANKTHKTVATYGKSR